MLYLGMYICSPLKPWQHSRSLRPQVQQQRRLLRASRKPRPSCQLRHNSTAAAQVGSHPQPQPSLQRTISFLRQLHHQQLQQQLHLCMLAAAAAGRPAAPPAAAQKILRAQRWASRPATSAICFFLHVHAEPLHLQNLHACCPSAALHAPVPTRILWSLTKCPSKAVVPLQRVGRHRRRA